jgi:hypothetical protein
MNGEECHNEWEITFEEIHRNGAIAYAIHNYIRYTNDYSYLAEYGIDVLTGIARFWAQRVHWSEAKGMYVMHGVTGPNEYENNVNNNWYTSYIARWCMQYAMEALAYVKQHDAQAYATKTSAFKFDEAAELKQWQHIIDNLYLGKKAGSNIFLQQDGFLDKELRSASSLKQAERPINQHWSWDRILRSCFIKQADVLQGIYFFEEDFDMDTIRDDGAITAGGGRFASDRDFLEACQGWAAGFQLDFMQFQPRHIELICEAGGMVPQLQKVAEPYGVTVRSSGGFDSTTVKHNLGRLYASHEKPVIALHVGDLDPSGEHICTNLGEDVGAFAAYYGGQASVLRIAVTADQQITFGLPTAPAKKTDRRSFSADFTVHAEALPPDALAAIVRDAI